MPPDQFIELDGARLPTRASLVQAIEEAWQRLAAAGTWWSGEERLCLAAEVRAAKSCTLCRQRKSALSPTTVRGRHEGQGRLPEAAVEAVHRLATDAQRVTATWLAGMLDAGSAAGAGGGPQVVPQVAPRVGGGVGLSEDAYVEIVSVVAIVTALDTFDLALGRRVRSLPQPVAGAPSRRRPAGARKNLAWIATVAPEDVTPGDPDPYPLHGDKNIHRALSLVPQAVIDFFDLDVELYLKDHEIRDFAREYRAISHAQIELIAGRASAINRCYY